MAICIYVLIWRPWKRERRVTTYGLMLFAGTTIYWLNFGGNYFSPTEVSNTAFHQWGSWYSYIPGWVSPNGGMVAEAPLLYLGMYGPTFVLIPLAIMNLMKKIKERYPTIGRGWLILWAVLFGMVFDFILEFMCLAFGVYAYAGAIAGFALFSGTHLQFPIQEILAMGCFMAVIALLLYYRDDRGQTWVERGLDGPQWTHKKKVAVRALALAGFFNVVFLAYNLAYSLVSLQPQTAWMKDAVEKRSYMRNYVCGEGTSYACPGRDIPMARRGAARAHIGPDGTLVETPGASETRYLR